MSASLQRSLRRLASVAGTPVSLVSSCKIVGLPHPMGACALAWRAPAARGLAVPSGANVGSIVEKGHVARVVVSSTVPAAPSTTVSAPPAPPPPTASSAQGVAVALPSRALAGVSPEYRQLWQERAAQGASANFPVAWNNPGAYGQLDRVPAEAVAAMPPPRRPLWPQPPAEITWRYARSFSIVFLFVGLALYLQAKSSLHGGAARRRLEARAPWLARLLVRVGALQDYSNLEVRAPPPLYPQSPPAQRSAEIT
jgi:hypothetical protein